ncbi:hypothetical protein KORDIASMS9_02475 [Kordia sp. SMS9]|uniref:alpha/beta hydrolase n=1 Tax=Kordia sp. SMS9 TaxID=2282170 RepID=UPI000E0D5954|nr:alpha/beta hydrolase [Kordia sp. SMS9]AXG70236.1 hypothetical protein KORDIASMS9_02475 [Kordia sp. SMS9]
MSKKEIIHVYGISGLGADKRIFDFLELKYEFTALDWIAPKPKESIKAYAQRLIDTYQLATKPNSVIVGVSFGGMIAAEMHELLETKKTVVISSATKSAELPYLYRFAGKLNLVRWIPKRLLKLNVHLAAFFFGTKQKKLLKAIIKDTDLHFLKWGMFAITKWKKTTKNAEIITIHGDEDKVIPAKGQKNYLIKNGGHFMIVDLADEVSKILNNEITNILHV